MNVFVDECVNYKLMRHLTGHQFIHATDTPWRGAKNGRLLRLAEIEYDAFLTIDRNIPYQQDLSRYDLAVIIIEAQSNNIEDLLPLVSRTLAALETIKPGDLVII